MFGRAVSRRLLSGTVRERVFENSHLSSFQQSNTAPLPPTYKFDSSAFVTVPTNVTTLDNGLRVATESTGGQTATIGVHFDAGSRSEKTSGVAHFLEHMIFKGTTKRSQVALEREIENIGAQFNAYTGRENTLYFARVLKKDIPVAVEILSDIVQHAELSAQAIEAERGVILREMEEVDKSSEEVVMDLLHETAYNKSPLGRTILGPRENIHTIKRDDLSNYIKANYTAPRCVLVGAGAVEHQQLVDLGTKAFGNLRKEPEAAPEPVTKSVFIGSDIRVRDDSQPHAHIAIAFEGVPWSSGDSFAQIVMQTMLGSWCKGGQFGKNSASRLVSQLAERELVESVVSFNSFYSDTSLFGAHARCEPEKLEDTCWIILREMVNLAYRTTDEDVQRAQSAVKAAFLLQCDDTTSIVDDIGRQLTVYGRRMSIAEIFARIDAVDAATVRRVAGEMIIDRDLAVAAKGALYAMPDYMWFRDRTYMLRY